jgi:hypothetical protein
MRLIVLAAASVLALAACSPSTPAATDGAASDAAKPADAAAGHDMAGMDDSMKSADTTDDANMAETREGYTFHTYPAKVESVHLPTAAGNVWTATASDPALVEVGEAKDEAMPDGATHHVVKVIPKASGNATVKFERRASANAADPVLETRTIKFMVH